MPCANVKPVYDVQSKACKAWSKRTQCTTLSSVSKLKPSNSRWFPQHCQTQISVYDAQSKASPKRIHCATLSSVSKIKPSNSWWFPQHCQTQMQKVPDKARPKFKTAEHGVGTNTVTCAGFTCDELQPGKAMQHLLLAYACRQ